MHAQQQNRARDGPLSKDSCSSLYCVSKDRRPWQDCTDTDVQARQDCADVQARWDAWMCRLAWAFPCCICDKYHFHISKFIYCMLHYIYSAKIKKSIQAIVFMLEWTWALYIDLNREKCHRILRSDTNETVFTKMQCANYFWCPYHSCKWSAKFCSALGNSASGRPLHLGAIVLTIRQTTMK